MTAAILPRKNSPMLFQLADTGSPTLGPAAAAVVALGVVALGVAVVFVSSFSFAGAPVVVEGAEVAVMGTLTIAVRFVRATGTSFSTSPSA